MKYIVIVLLLFFINSICAQNNELTEVELNSKLDSILMEANLLYKYEKSAWLSTDMAFSNKKINKDIAEYFTYEGGGDIKTIFINEKGQCIAEYLFNEDDEESVIETREIDIYERELLSIRRKLLDQLNSGKYNVSVPDNYSLNAILLPFGEKYKLYVITGTSQQNVIPFGNDYLFIADKKGTIQNSKKFHSSLIPSYTEIDGEKAMAFVHSHLKTTPLICATDICTFMLYAPLYKVNQFSVYSPALQKYMMYDLRENKIIVKDK